jgi:hypothetical protein
MDGYVECEAFRRNLARAGFVRFFQKPQTKPSRFSNRAFRTVGRSVRQM